MDWRKKFEHKIVTAAQAIGHIKSGDKVVIGHGAGEPSCLTFELMQNKNHCENIQIIYAGSEKEIFHKNHQTENFFETISLSGQSLSTGKNGFCLENTIPCYLHEIPELFKTTLSIDVVLVQLSPPDNSGKCSFGVSVDYIKPAAMSAKIVIAQINSRMPRSLGDAFLHISDVDFIVECDEALKEGEKNKINDVPMLIGKYCTQLIQNGDTLQIGVGSIADAILFCLSTKKDLGIHSAIMTDAIMDLVKMGVVTNRKKSIDCGQVAASCLWGSIDLYHFIHYNYSVTMYPIDYITRPNIIMQIDNFVSIHTCSKVDFTGQVSSENGDNSISDRLGGTADFVRGAKLSKGGRTIITLASTSLKGHQSNIIPYFDDNSTICISKNDVDYVITEYGIAHLKGRPLKERAQALIQIAHPQFRSFLKEELENMLSKEERESSHRSVYVSF